MSKLFTVVVSVFISSPVLAAPSICVQGIVKENAWNKMTATQIDCLAQASEAQAHFSALCSSNQKEFSAEYKTYLSYEAKYKSAENAIDAAGDEAAKNAAFIDLNAVDSEWKAVGFKNEIITELWPLTRIKAKCERR